MMRAFLLAALAASVSAFQMQSSRVAQPRAQVSMGPLAELKKLSAAASAASVSLYIQAAEAKSVVGELHCHPRIRGSARGFTRGVCQYVCD